jgi:hypothetical protein
MKVKELKEKLEKALKQGSVSEEDEVIISGEYGLGMRVSSADTDKVAETDEEIIRENMDAFVLDVPTYVYEREDVGNCHMFMPMNVLDEYREFFEDEEDD